MATYVFNDMYDATIRAPEKLGPKFFCCQVKVGLRTGEITQSSFNGEGTTAKRAELDALQKAREAIAAGKINL